MYIINNEANYIKIEDVHNKNLNLVLNYLNLKVYFIFYKMIKIYSNILFLILIFISFGCKSKTEYNESKNKVKIDGMVWIPGGIYQQGA